MKIELKLKTGVYCTIQFFR